MPEPTSGSHLRIVRPEPAARRVRGPGLAVLSVALYSLLFLAALLYLRSRIGTTPRGGEPSRPPAAVLPDRLTLLSGEALAADSRRVYASVLDDECCDCGCDLTLRRCLATDEQCRRSTEMAAGRMSELQ